MTYQEKQSVTSLFAMTVATLTYFSYAAGHKYQEIDPTNAQELAWALLVFIMFQIGIQIVGQILLAIAESVRREYRKESTKDFDKLDEREKIVDGKGERYGMYIYMISVFVGVIFVAQHSDIRTLFLAIGIGGLASGALTEFFKLYLSRKGV